MTERRQLLHLFNFYLVVLFLRKYKELLPDTAEEVDMQLKFTFFSPVISRSFFTDNRMVDPWIKWRKSKDRAKKLSKKRPYQDLSKCVHISRFVSHRTSTLPFLLKVPALLPIKLVCHWFLWLAKHIVKWWDMPSYLTQERVPGVTLSYGIYRYMQPQRVRFSAVLAINSV